MKSVMVFFGVLISFSSAFAINAADDMKSAEQLEKQFNAYKERAIENEKVRYRSTTDINKERILKDLQDSVRQKSNKRIADLLSRASDVTKGLQWQVVEKEFVSPDKSAVILETLAYAKNAMCRYYVRVGGEVMKDFTGQSNSRLIAKKELICIDTKTNQFTVNISDAEK